MHGWKIIVGTRIKNLIFHLHNFNFFFIISFIRSSFSCFDLACFFAKALNIMIGIGRARRKLIDQLAVRTLPLNWARNERENLPEIIFSEYSPSFPLSLDFCFQRPFAEHA